MIKDTIMGTIFALTYAALLMGYSKTKLNNTCNSQYWKFLADHFKEN